VAEIVAVRRGGRRNLGLWIYFSGGLRGPDRHRITPYSLALSMAFKMGYRRRHIFLANVPDDLLPLAFGTKACYLLYTLPHNLSAA